MSKYPARLYRYVGSSEIQLHVAGSPIGKRIQSVSELLDWIAQTKKEPNAWELIPATFVIDVERYLRVADRHSEHIACAGGQPVLSEERNIFYVW